MLGFPASRGCSSPPGPSPGSAAEQSDRLEKALLLLWDHFLPLTTLSLVSPEFCIPIFCCSRVVYFFAHPPGAGGVQRESRIWREESERT
ncbi:hypothetical protein GN956_G5696 [Arapaima gigas]